MRNSKALLFTKFLPMAALVDLVTNSDLSTTETPALILFSDEDQVVRAEATRAVAAAWGGPVTLAPQVLPPGNDPDNHVIAGDIISPGMTEPVTKTILDWISSL